MLTDDQLRSMPVHERSDLARRLAALAAAEQSTAIRRHQRQGILIASTLASVLLIPWIILMALTLPHRYVATHWTLTWVGFDVALLTSLSLTAWFGFRRRQAVVLVAFIAATLLTCDAWFDITTASTGRDLAGSIASAALVELPLAMLLFRTALHLVNSTVRRVRMLAGEEQPSGSLVRMPLFGPPPR